MVATNAQFKVKLYFQYISVSFRTLKDIESKTIPITGQVQAIMPGLKSLT
ncbi:hypothetical protein HYE43_00835 [Mycoplasmopsis bovis]|nr:hypothetical protein [Mycoplasmopsis bovis]QQH20135.1 hypothetical protein HYE43_00835 [Mycoplasmopsis bovis]